MDDVLNALAELPKLDRRAAEFCEESHDFREFVRGSSSVGRVCSFVNLVKFILDEMLRISAYSGSIQSYKRGLYAFTLEIIQYLKQYRKEIDDFDIAGLINVVLVKAL